MATSFFVGSKSYIPTPMDMDAAAAAAAPAAPPPPPPLPAAAAEAMLIGGSNTPVSDLEVAAQYAAQEIQTVAQLATPAPMLATPARPPASADGDSSEESDSESEDEEMAAPLAAAEKKPASEGEDESESEDEGEKYDTAKLRAEIEAAMESEAVDEDGAPAGGPLTTPNEITSAPVRTPEVEIKPDTAIAECGSILNLSAPGLMVTVKALMNAKPLDEGSVLCLEDRSMLGCVDEVFGPVLMPMYLVRFASADKIPPAAAMGARVFLVTEHTTFIEPEAIKDKGTDASNLYDEETDEVVYSDDEAEAAAKRQHRKRNRGGAPASSASSRPNHPRSSYTPNNGPRPPAANTAEYKPPTQPYAYSNGVAFQVQPFGGQTKYTTGPVIHPPRPAFGHTNYTSPRGYTPPASAPAPPPYNSAPVYHQHAAPPVPSPYQTPTSYHAPYQPPPPAQAAYGAPYQYRPPQQPSGAYLPQPTGAYPPQPHGAYPPQPNGAYPPQQYHQGPQAPRGAPAPGGYPPNAANQPPLPRGGYQDRRY